MIINFCNQRMVTDLKRKPEHWLSNEHGSILLDIRYIQFQKSKCQKSCVINLNVRKLCRDFSIQAFQFLELAMVTNFKRKPKDGSILFDNKRIQYQKSCQNHELSTQMSGNCAEISGCPYTSNTQLYLCRDFMIPGFQFLV